MYPGTVVVKPRDGSYLDTAVAMLAVPGVPRALYFAVRTDVVSVVFLV